MIEKKKKEINKEIKITEWQSERNRAGKWDYLCPIMIITFTYILHTQHVATIMGQ